MVLLLNLLPKTSFFLFFNTLRSKAQHIFQFYYQGPQLYLIQILCIKRVLMDTNLEVRKKRDDIRKSLKISLTRGGLVCSDLPESNKNNGNQSQVQKTQKVQQESPPPPRISRRKTSFDIRGMGDTFDMFECNQVLIFNDFDEMYELVRKIDEGAQAVVYEGIEKKTKNKYAVKVIRKKDSDIIQSLKTQFRVLKNLNHPNIIKAYNLFVDQRLGISHLVLQYCQFPNLRYYMNQHRTLKETQIAEILTLIFHALVYLHSQGVCHRDIKPQNILFNPVTRQIKLIDFQISKMIKYNHQKLQMLDNVGTTFYKAPQILNCNFYHQQVDIWAVGIICYEMAMGYPPFRHKYESQLIKQIKQSEPKYDTSNSTDFCINFIKKCLQKDPLKRFSAIQALKAPFLLKYSSISSSTNSSPMRRKNSEEHIKNSFGIELSKCLNEDSGLKNVESLGIDSGIRVKINQTENNGYIGKVALKRGDSNQ